MKEIRSSRKLALLASAALLAAVSVDGAFAQANRTKSSIRTSREASLLAFEDKAACTVDPARELFITNVSVVDDCFRTTWGIPCPPPVLPATRGAWTFGGLMPGIFGTNVPATLSAEVTTWLNEWAVFKNINGDPVFPRPNVQNLVIGPWLAASGGVQLDMRRAPFRLLAIVSRLDLRQPASAPGGLTAGEGRFVFNLLDPNGNKTEYLLIFEYGLDAADCRGVLGWANQWHNLGTIPFGPNYNAALQRVTDRFTRIGASPAKPNGSALNQARTNDFFLAAPWELREFTLQGGPVASLLMSTVAQTPADSHQNSALFASFVNAGPPFDVPLTWLLTPFRGGASTHFLNFNWDGPPPPCTSIPAFNDRHLVSLNTCNGCHGAETQTFFKHVEPRNVGVPSVLSQFLTGSPPIVDMCGLAHTFGDIALRRADLCNLLVTPCPALAAEPVNKFVH
jgi:hypothetical protein